MIGRWLVSSNQRRVTGLSGSSRMSKRQTRWLMWGGLGERPTKIGDTVEYQSRVVPHISRRASPIQISPTHAHPRLHEFGISPITTRHGQPRESVASSDYVIGADECFTLGYRACTRVPGTKAYLRSTTTTSRSRVPQVTLGTQDNSLGEPRVPRSSLPNGPTNSISPGLGPIGSKNEPAASGRDFAPSWVGAWGVSLGKACGDRSGTDPAWFSRGVWTGKPQKGGQSYLWAQVFNSMETN